MASGVNISHLVMVFNEQSCVDAAVAFVLVSRGPGLDTLGPGLVALGPGLIDAFII